MFANGHKTNNFSYSRLMVTPMAQAQLNRAIITSVSDSENAVIRFDI
jgi:hypothetical protein